MHNLQRSVHHRNATNKSLTEALAECRHQNLLSEAAEQSLLDGFGPIAKEILLNEIKNVGENKHGHRFSDNIRAFALTVFYYSPCGYNFLRTGFLFAKH